LSESPSASFVAPEQGALLTGTVHVHIAFDWGEEVDFARVHGMVPAEVHRLSRRRRTPASIAYRPPPLSFALDEIPLELPEIGAAVATAEATVFDFGAVSVALQIPFRLEAESLSRFASYSAETVPMVEAARAAVEPLYRKLLPAIEQPTWSQLSEEYFVFQFPPGPPLPSSSELLATRTGWLARLVRMESGSLSDQEVHDALRLNLSYSPDDLFIPDWAAAVLIDRDCEETLQTIEFANIQLLEFRHLDQRLDDRLGAAYRLIHPRARSWLPPWRTYVRPLRSLGELRVEANSMLERPGNVLKLVGDPYLARVYNQLAKRFHLDEWELSVRHSLDLLQGIYTVVADQAATLRTELLEVIIILLIMFEIAMALIRRS
jgi:hypothetical protein